MYDSTLGIPNTYVPDENSKSTRPWLVESAWVEPLEPEPPDKDNLTSEEKQHLDPEHAGLEYRHHLNLRAQRIRRLHNNDNKPFIPVTGLTEGNDWHQRPDGSWSIPSLDLELEQIDTATELYDQTFVLDNLIVTKCDKAPTQINGSKYVKIQSDTGANANITSDLDLHFNVQWIEPIKCDSAEQGAILEIQAIGRYIIPGTALMVNMYFCPDTQGTIISPTALVRQNQRHFIGYQKYLHLDNETGYIELIPKDDCGLTQIPIHIKNDLCYHSHSNATIDPAMAQDLFDAHGSPITPTVSRLSDAAKWELWHQRLAHPGHRVITTTQAC